MEYKMSYLNRVWMAATVAVVSGHADQGCKLKSAIGSFHHATKQRISSSGAGGSPGRDLRPLSCADRFVCGGEERREQADDSLRQVMYLSCWGTS